MQARTWLGPSTVVIHMQPPLDVSRRKNLSRSSRGITRSGYSRSNSQSDLPLAIPCRSAQSASSSTPAGRHSRATPSTPLTLGLLRIARRLDGGKPLCANFELASVTTMQNVQALRS